MADKIDRILDKLLPEDREIIVEEFNNKEISVQNSMKLLRMTNDLATEINLSDNLEDISLIVLKKLKSITKTANFIVALLDSDKKKISFPFFVDEKDNLTQIADEENSIPADQEGSLTVEVLKQGKPLFFTKDTIINYTETNDIYLGAIPVFWFGYPLKIERKIIGAIIVQTYEESSFFNFENLDSLEYIFSHLAPFYERNILVKKLKSIEKDYKSLLNNSQDIIFRADMQGKILSVSPYIQKLTGIPAKSYINTFLKDIFIIDPMTREKLYKELYEKGSLKNYEFQFKEKNKKGSWISVNAHIIKNKKGAPIGIEGIARDITDKKKTEMALLTSEKKYRDLFEKSQDAILIIEDNKFIDCNKSAISMLKYSDKNEVLNLHPSKISPRKQPDGRDSKEKADEMIAIALKKGTNRFEWEHKKSDGEIFSVDVLLTTITQEDGKNIIYTVWRDITDKKKAEMALLASEKKYRDLFEKTQDAILIIEDNKIIDCNKAAISMLKYSDKKEFLNLHPSKISPRKQPDGRDSKEKADEMIAIALKKGTLRFEWEHKKSDGEIFPADILLTPITQEDGKTIIHSVCRDITNRKKAEKTIIETQRLGAIGEMASGVAHDFNNSLQSILGYIEIALRYENIPDKLKKYLNIMHKSALDAASRIQLLQRFGGKTKKKDNFKTISVNSILDDVIKQSRPIWKDKAEKDGIEIKIIKNFNNIPQINGYIGELRTAFYNVLKNSIEAIKKDGEIIIETSVIEKNIQILIKDTGMGMEHKTASRIFQPLFSTKGLEIGRGYGMSAVYSIIKEHSSKIAVKNSQIGIGTTIEILLPIAYDSHGLKEENDKKHNYSDPKKDIRLLWVDDDPIIRAVADKYMSELDIQCDLAESGKKALELLKSPSNKYDVMITDIGMPHMNGWELSKKVKEEFGEKIKIGVVTGWTKETGKDVMEKSGVSLLLNKPVTLKQIEKLINDLIML